MQFTRVHNGEFHNLYTSPNIITLKPRRMRWAGHAARIGETRIAYKIVVGKPEGKGRPRRRWENNMRMDLGKTGWEVVDRIHVAQDRDQWQALVNTVMHFRFP
jgi:hypothetical protein